MINIKYNFEKMKKVLFVLISVVFAVGMVFTSCGNRNAVSNDTDQTMTSDTTDHTRTLSTDTMTIKSDTSRHNNGSYMKK